MNNSLQTGRWGLPLFGALLATGLIVSTWVAGNTLQTIKVRDNTLQVKGYAEKPIVADLGIWSATITVRGKELIAATNKMESHRELLFTYFTNRGFPREVIQTHPVVIRIVYVKNERGQDTNEIDRYELFQAFEVQSDDVTRIADVARYSSELLQQGVELKSLSPQYIFTKLEDLKLDMLGQATANARQRADQLISNGGVSIGELRSASQGVFQIVPEHSTDVSDYGRNDTSTIRKTIKAVVTIEFALE